MMSYAPRIYGLMRKGYSKRDFKKDAVAGLTVAIISIPLAIALAIASGVSPANGLYTAIIAGFLTSLFGGSRFQIGGPTGAFVVVVFNVIALYGYQGLLLATLIAGILLVIAGFLKLGEYIKYIPYPVIVGFTSGIAVLLFSTQVKDFIGLDIENVPAEILPKWQMYFENINSFSWPAVFISLVSLGIIITINVKRPKWPSYLIAVAVVTVMAVALPFAVDTIGSKFDNIPRFLPMPQMPEFDLELVFKVFPSALTIAFLAGVESLLSATIADAMSGDEHNPNAELIGQGISNAACAFFSGMPATGAIARTATNIKSGGYSPVSGMMQSFFLLLFLIVLSPLAAFIPLSCLSVILILIAFGMFNFPKFFDLLRGQRGDKLTLLVTFLLTVFVDLNAAISVGFIMYSIIFIHRISGEVGANHSKGYEPKNMLLNERMYKHGIMSIRLSGPMFFGGANKIARFFKAIQDSPRIVILRMDNVPMIDISGTQVIIAFVKKMKKQEAKIIFSDVQPQPKNTIALALKDEHVSGNIYWAVNFPTAVKKAKQLIEKKT